MVGKDDSTIFFQKNVLSRVRFFLGVPQMGQKIQINLFTSNLLWEFFCLGNITGQFSNSKQQMGHPC